MLVKKITKPAEREESVYYSDVSGKIFDQFGPEVEISVEFNYGSKFDGSKLHFHLTDKESLELLRVFKQKLSMEFKVGIKQQLGLMEDSYDDSVSTRDWSNCESLSNSMELMRFLSE